MPQAVATPTDSDFRLFGVNSATASSGPQIFTKLNLCRLGIRGWSLVR